MPVTTAHKPERKKKQIPDFAARGRQRGKPVPVNAFAKGAKVSRGIIELGYLYRKLAREKFSSEKLIPKNSIEGLPLGKEADRAIRERFTNLCFSGNPKSLHLYKVFQLMKENPIQNPNVLFDAIESFEGNTSNESLKKVKAELKTLLSNLEDIKNEINHYVEARGYRNNKLVGCPLNNFKYN